MSLYPEYPSRRQNGGRFFTLDLIYYSSINHCKMKIVIKQVVGIDVAQDELVTTLGRILSDMEIELFARKVFKNTVKGRATLLTWVKKLTDKTVPLRYVMEATGVYHEKLAYLLDEKKYDVSVVLPNKIRNFFLTLDVKTVTDKTAADAIAQFGLGRKLDNWHRPKPLFRELRQLTRERDQVVQDRTITKNQLHAETTEAVPNKSSLKRLKERIRLLDKHEAQIRKEATALTKTDPELYASIKRVCTIPGVGELTAIIILAETYGFDLIRNKAQLTSYAGLDVKEKQSGTSVKGKPKISKKGNRHLRKCLYLPAWTAIKRTQDFNDLFVRLVSKHGIKMKAGVAVQRKLLELVYIIYKNDTVFDPEYLLKKEELAIKQKAEKEGTNGVAKSEITRVNGGLKSANSIRNQQSEKTNIKEEIKAEKKIGNSLKKPLPIQADLCRLE